MRFAKYSPFLGIILLSPVPASVAVGQHSDVLLQSDGTKIAVGSASFDSFSWTIGTRVFARDFDSDYLIDNPGYNALSNSSPFLPSGYYALPASSPVSWDFLPMTFPGSVGNLLYWNGQDINANGVDSLDVAFAPLPGATISLAGAGGTAVANGSAQLVEGRILAVTDSTGALHSHRNYRLDDGDSNSGTYPLDGIYLVSLRVRMGLLEESDPFFLVFGTPGSKLSARNAAVSWIRDRVDTLVVTGLPGDYNADNMVDAADYNIWRDSLGQSIALPNEYASPNFVDAADYMVWKTNFGQSVVGDEGIIASTSVPEPSTIGNFLGATLILSLTIWRQKPARRGLE